MREILEKFLNGEINIKECENLLKADNILKFDQIAKLDSSRSSRTGFPEAIFAPSKDYDDLLLIIKNYFKNRSKKISKLIITKLENKRFQKLDKDLSYLKDKGFILNYNEKAKILVIKSEISKEKKKIATIGIITAGTSDINIAEEAKVVLEENHCKVVTSYDLGVAGIHRLFPQLSNMIKEDVKAIIVCAGMEGALPSVVAGLVDVPVIGVPTSVGYGVGEGGIVALNSMLQSCSPGIAVVNIDNGFGAGVFALSVARTSLK